MAGRRKPIFNMASFLIVIVVLIVLVIASGYFFSRQCTDAADRSFCWSTVSHDVQSDLCPGSNLTFNATCSMDPSVDQHNALVDAIIYACGRVTNDTSGNVALRINELYYEMSGVNQTVDQICSGNYLSKWSYAG